MRDRRRSLWAGAAVAATFLCTAACASGSPASPTTTGSTPPAASTTQATATVSQYASIVAPISDGYADAWKAFQDECALVAKEPATCPIRRMTLRTLADTLVLSLTGAAKPGVPGYIGPPPAEIGRLVTDTVTAARRVVDAIPAGGEAKDGQFAVAASLSNALGRWTPYI